MYQYGAKTEQEMVSDLVRMGFDEEDLYDILDGDFEDFSFAVIIFGLTNLDVFKFTITKKYNNIHETDKNIIILHIRYCT